MIHRAGLHDYYSRASGNVPTVEVEASTEYSDAELDSLLQPDSGGGSRIDLLVNGITCPSCVWLLERMILSIGGVQGVSFTYAARTVSVRFDRLVLSPSAIISTISALGYAARPYTPMDAEKEAGREKTDLLIRFGTALFLTMQLMVYSVALYAGYFHGIDPSAKVWLQYFSGIVSAPVIFYCGAPFLKGAWTGIRSRMPGMDLLIATGSLSAYIYSLYAMFTGGETFFESAAMIVTFVLLGRLLEISVRRRAVAGLESLLTSIPRFACRIGEHGLEELPVDKLLPGDMLLLRKGERLPVDAIMVAGEAEFDESAMTGESVPVLRHVGEELKGGSLNLSGTVLLRTERPVSSSFVMRIAGMVREAQGRKPRIQRLADRLSAIFVPSVITLSLTVGIIQWQLFGLPLSSAVTVALSILLIACPCAVGLAVPSAILAACSHGASRGILIRGGDVIERLAAISRAAFDKTGTLTMGSPEVISCVPVEGRSLDSLLEMLGALEQGETHPLAKALSAYAGRHVESIEMATGTRSWPGLGIGGRLSDGTMALCGNRRLMEKNGVEIPPGLEEGLSATATVVYLSVDQRIAGIVQLEDSLRGGAFQAVSLLAANGIPSTVISGDRAEVVESLAGRLGIPDFLSGMTPEEKAEWVAARQSRGDRLLFAGDGVNDAPALALASVSCVPAGSSDLALENADLILENGEIELVPQAYLIACRCMVIIRQNLLWAFIYNIIGIPLAIFGMLTPVYAAAAMTASSLMVSLNSMRLLKGNSKWMM